MTDRGQPIREFPAEHHGQRKGLRELQQAAPLHDASTSGPGEGVGVDAPAPSPIGVDFSRVARVFDPTERPAEPQTAGPGDPPPFPADPNLMLRVLYLIRPDTRLLAAIRDR